ncbi:MAG: F0F1 ATP synthase subunit A [Faecalibacterium sp.]|jgi:F-type H+-transporting ATPase subunit a|nr:F0F1 ATP synthase subunit A [Faecalibacterium sp.]
MDIQLNGAKILFTIHTGIPVLGDLKISQTLVMTWIVMGIITALCLWLSHDLKLANVSKRQAAAEFIVEKLDGFVRGNMGQHFDQYIPLVGAIFCLSVFCNLISVLGFWSPTADLNTELAWAVVVFILITYHKIKAGGILGYLKGYLDPIFLMAPINVISELATPVSMACRHFGNILSGMVIATLIYSALAAASYALFGALGTNLILAAAFFVVGLVLLYRGMTKVSKKTGKKGSLPGKVFGAVLTALGALAFLSRLPGVLGTVFTKLPWLDLGLPAFTSLYFDWFSGCIQAFIFCTLTTIFIKQASGED